MGQKPKVTAEYKKERLRKTSERIEALKESLNVTYDGLADYLGLSSSSTLRNYARSRSLMRSDIAKIFETRTNIIGPYWMGETDCTTWEQYSLEQFEKAVDKHERIQEQEQIIIEKRKVFFSLIGFQYRASDSITMQRITSNSTPSLSARFTDDELKDLFSRIQEVIELEVFKKSKQV